MVVGGSVPVDGVWRAVRDSQVWMVEHAVPELGYTDAAAAFRDSEEDAGRMRRWANAVMSGSGDPHKFAGELASPEHLDRRITLNPYPC